MCLDVLSKGVLILLLALSIGCNKPPNDDQIKHDIQAKVATEPETKESAVTVASQQGKVSIQGKVRTSAARTKVEQIAKAEPGVAEVHDETSVDPNLSPTAQTTTSSPASIASETPQAKESMPPPPPPPPPVVVPAGTVLTIRTSQPLSSKDSQAGQTFLGTLAQPVSVEDRAAFPAGSTVSGTVVNAKSKGKIKGEGQLDLALTSITVRDHTYRIETAVLSSTEKGKGKRTAATTGGGAAGGALIGGLAGGGKGAGVGALVGAGTGLVGGALTGNKQIEIPAESALSFTLTQPLTLERSATE